ncbi:MAG TPA: hypothetical protein PLK99_04380 [Burkholderiales bacterium]|nr:hypothetical protein [Burkholderiales bacterium]
MRKLTPIFLLLLAACSSGKNGVKVGTVFSPNPDVVTCPTRALLVKLDDYAQKKDEKDYKSMLLDGGGLCTTLPSIATMVVAEVDGKMIRIAPQRSPDARGVWTSPEILGKPR